MRLPVHWEVMEYQWYTEPHQKPVCISKNHNCTNIYMLIIDLKTLRYICTRSPTYPNLNYPYPLSKHWSQAKGTGQNANIKPEIDMCMHSRVQCSYHSLCLFERLLGALILRPRSCKVQLSCFSQSKVG